MATRLHPELVTANFPATWIAREAPLAYRVMPKCACSSIGQWLHHLDHGAFYPGEIHDRGAPILKWGNPADSEAIAHRLGTGRHVHFTFVRNPYRRLVSAFADKIFGYQSSGGRYRGGLIHRKLFSYGVNFGPKSRIVDNFRGFVRFVADTVEKGEPMASDLHWTPCAAHLAYNTAVNPSWRPDFIGHVERLHAGLVDVAGRVGLPPEAVPAQLPRENTTSLGPIRLEDLYGDDEIATVRRVYRDDFALFGYSDDPRVGHPVAEVDLAAVAAACRRR
jgi:hypothetical protein